MSLLVPNTGLSKILHWAFIDASEPGSLQIDLYTNALSPVAASVLGDFITATFTGYSAGTITRAGWNAPTLVSGVTSITYGSAIVFTCSGGSPQTIQGYCVSLSGVLIWGERFDAPRTISSGNSISIVPRISDSTGGA